MTINNNAPVITRDQIVINSPIDRVWSVQTDIAAWPQWQPGIQSMTINGPVAPGTQFQWQTDGLQITSTIREVSAPTHIAWGGPAQGITAVHVWTLTQQDAGVLVHTEESWEGPEVDSQVEQLQKALDASLRNWLQNLKQRAESTD